MESVAAKVESVRKARADDAGEIYSIIDRHAERGVMLERSIENIYDNLRDFFVVETIVEKDATSGEAETGRDGSRVAGVCSLHIWGAELAEIRSIAVEEAFTGTGIGSTLVSACLEEARAIGLKKVFALTYMTGFFEKLGFYVEDKALLPQKIWGDCARCARFPSCDETAVVIELG